MVNTDDSTTQHEKQSTALPATGREPAYLDCCQICGDIHDLKSVEILHGGLLKLCKQCRRLFFVDAPEGQGVKRGN